MYVQKLLKGWQTHLECLFSVYSSEIADLSTDGCCESHSLLCQCGEWIAKVLLSLLATIIWLKSLLATIIWLQSLLATANLWTHLDECTTMILDLLRSAWIFMVVGDAPSGVLVNLVKMC